MIKLLITDLDDTLYSWIEFFVPAFYEMLEELSLILHKPQQLLIQEYKKVHQEKGSVEYPYATLLLPSVKSAYPSATKEELIATLNPAFHKFNSYRKHHLKLYPRVGETLKAITSHNVKVVGYTDSAEENGFYRLKVLGIADYFQTVYVSDSQFDRPKNLPSSKKTVIVHGKKPNPNLIRDICRRENVAAHETLYLGDSMTKDIYMAKLADVTAVLCQYPCDTKKRKELYSKLVAISNWTDVDFRNDLQIRRICQSQKIRPDYAIDSFDKVFSIIQEINTDKETNSL